jgi:Fic family protein
MYSPKFTITNSVLKNIGLCEACKEVIDNAPLVPAWEKRFQDEAVVKTVHYGTHLEGNDLSFQEASNVLEGKEVVARERDIQEVINYRNVLKYIDDLGTTFENTSNNHPKYNKEQLLKIHHLTVSKIVSKEHESGFRQSAVVLRNSLTGEVTFRPPSFIEVTGLVDSFLNWLNDSQTRNLHPVIQAAITHYVLVAIHPFTEGNGRTARAFSTLVLFSEGYDTKRFFSFEEYFDKDAISYFGTLMTVSNQGPNLENRDLTPWIEYFSQALSVELVRIKEKVKKLSVDLKIKGRLGRQVALSERQMKLVEYLEEFKQITVPQARQSLPMVSDDTILRDLKDLAKKGIVKKEGSTKSATYVIRG